MYIIKRNQIILTALVAMVAVAGYLNFAEKSVGESGEVATVLSDETDAYGLLMTEGAIDTLADDADASTDPLTAEAVTSSDEDALTAEAVTSDDTGAAIFVNAGSESVQSSEYFMQAKLDREQSRSKQKDILTEMINNGNIEQTQKAECASSMLDLQKRIEKETAAEAMIESKGFKEAYVRIDDTTVDVVVAKDTLTDQEVAQIMDIVKRKTGFTDDKIRISPLQKS